MTTTPPGPHTPRPDDTGPGGTGPGGTGANSQGPLLQTAPRAEDGTIERAWLHEFAAVTRMLTLRLFDEINTCIASTAIGLAILDRFSVRAIPMTVEAVAMNREGYLWSQKGVRPDQWPDDAWSVAVGVRARATDVQWVGSGWPGHLVIVVRDPGQPRLLIDLTADQFSRPHKNLVVDGPVFMGIPTGSAWTPGEPLFTILDRDQQNPTFISYAPARPGDPEAKRWKDSGSWTDTVARLGDPEDIGAHIDAIVTHLAAWAPTGADGTATV